MINLQKDKDTGKWIVMIDASSITRSACFRRFYLTNLCGLKKGVNSIDIEFGSAFHIFAKRLPLVGYDESKLGLAIQPAQKYFRDTPHFLKVNKTFLTVEYLTKVCIEFFNQVWLKDARFEILQIKGEYLTEKNCAIKITSTDIADYLLTFTIDKIGMFKFGPYCLGDYKTKGTYKKDRWDIEYLSSPQIFTYIYGIKRLGELHPDSIFGEFYRNTIGLFIDAIFVSSKDKIEFDRSRTFYPTEIQLKEYESFLYKLTNRIDVCLKLNAIPFREGLFNGYCMDGFHPCDYYNACFAPDERSMELILKNDFIQKIYDPLTFGKEK